jgi:shikimate kinase
MNRAGLTVYFKMSPEKLAGRLEHGKAKRPLLRDKSEEELIGFIRENVAKREKYYMQAKLIIDCDGVRDDYIAHHIAEYIETKKEQ